MSRPSRRMVALRECLVAALQSAAPQAPPSTDTLRAAVPAHLLRWSSEPVAYPQLRALERMGLCRRVKDPRYKAVFWRWTGDETFAAAVAELDNHAEPGAPRPPGGRPAPRRSHGRPAAAGRSSASRGRSVGRSSGRRRPVTAPVLADVLARAVTLGAFRGRDAHQLAAGSSVPARISAPINALLRSWPAPCP